MGPEKGERRKTVGVEGGEVTGRGDEGGMKGVSLAKGERGRMVGGAVGERTGGEVGGRKGEGAAEGRKEKERDWEAEGVEMRVGVDRREVGREGEEQKEATRLIFEILALLAGSVLRVVLGVVVGVDSRPGGGIPGGEGEGEGEAEGEGEGEGDGEGEGEGEGEGVA